MSAGETSRITTSKGIEVTVIVRGHAHPPTLSTSDGFTLNISQLLTLAAVRITEGHLSPSIPVGGLDQAVEQLSITRKALESNLEGPVDRLRDKTLEKTSRLEVVTRARELGLLSQNIIDFAQNAEPTLQIVAEKRRGSDRDSFIEINTDNGYPVIIRAEYASGGKAIMIACEELEFSLNELRVYLAVEQLRPRVFDINEIARIRGITKTAIRQQLNSILDTNGQKFSTIEELIHHAVDLGLFDREFLLSLESFLS